MSKVRVGIHTKVPMFKLNVKSQIPTLALINAEICYSEKLCNFTLL